MKRAQRAEPFTVCHPANASGRGLRPESAGPVLLQPLPYIAHQIADAIILHAVVLQLVIQRKQVLRVGAQRAAGAGDQWRDHGGWCLLQTAGAARSSRTPAQ